MKRVELSAEAAIEILNLALQNEQGFMSSIYNAYFGNKNQDTVSWFTLQKRIGDD